MAQPCLRALSVLAIPFALVAPAARLLRQSLLQRTCPLTRSSFSTTPAQPVLTNRAESTQQAAQVVFEETPPLVSQPPSSAVATQPQPAYQKPGGVAIVPQYGPRVCYMHNSTAAWDCCQECNRPVCGLCINVQEVFHDDDTSRHCCEARRARLPASIRTAMNRKSAPTARPRTRMQGPRHSSSISEVAFARSLPRSILNNYLYFSLSVPG